MATKELNVKDNPISNSLKKIDDYISSVEEKLLKLRENGENQVLSLKRDLSTVKGDHTLSPEEKEKLISQKTAELDKARIVQEKNKEKVNSHIKEGTDYLRANYKVEYQSKVNEQEKAFIKEENARYNAEVAKIKKQKCSEAYVRTVEAGKEKLSRENIRYKNEMDNFISKINHDAIAKSKEKGNLKIAKENEKFKSELAKLKESLGSKEVISAKELGKEKQAKAKAEYLGKIAEIKSQYLSNVEKIKADSNPDELKKALKEEKDSFITKKNRSIIEYNALVKSIKNEQNVPVERIKVKINDLKIEHDLAVKEIAVERDAPLNEVKLEKRKINLLHKKVVNQIKTEINVPKKELRKELDDAYAAHKKALREHRAIMLNASIHKDELVTRLNNKTPFTNKLHSGFSKFGTGCSNFSSSVGHGTKYFFVDLPKNSKKVVKNMPNARGFNSITSSIVSIIIGILVGFLFMIVAMAFAKRANPFSGLGIILSGPFGGRNAAYNWGNMLFYTVPLIFTGLSVGIAFKTGLFNIGAPGQFLMGTMGALLVALTIDTSGNRFAGVLVWILALFVGMILAILWAFIPGFLKAQFGINEVIISIMTNWIAANLFTWIFNGIEGLHNRESGKSAYLITTSSTGNFTPTWNLGKLFGNSYLDMSIILAIVVAILMWLMMNKTTLGYSLKACGYNRNAAKYAGINEKLNIMIAMGIAGALAGLGGAFYYLNPNIEINYKLSYQVLPAYGFNGIPAALLANCNPIGIVFSAFFIRYINASSQFLPKAGYNQYIGEIIIAIIIYLAGFSRFFNEKINQIKKFFTIRNENTKREMESLELPSEEIPAKRGK